MPSFPERLRQLDENERRLLTVIREEGPATRQQLEMRLGLSSSSVHRLVGRLEALALLAARGEAQSGGGRRPVLYGIGKGNGVLAGVEISRTEVRMLLCTPDLVPVERMRFALSSRHDPETTVREIAGNLRDAMARQRLRATELPGIGVGTVGLLDREQGRIRSTTGFPNEGWQQVPIVRMLAESTGMPVFLDNGANMAVSAEHLARAGAGEDPLVYIHLGMGIRTGVFAKGGCLRHIGEPMDAFGHLSVDMYGHPCACGQMGCMETYATLPALATWLDRTESPGGSAFQSFLEQADHLETSLEELEHLKPSLEELEHLEISLKQADCLDTSHEQADPRKATARLVAAATIFGIGLAQFLRMMDARHVVLSGPVIRSSRLFYEVAVRKATNRLRQQMAALPTFSRDGSLGEWAIATGAAAYPFGLSLKATDGLDGANGSGGADCTVGANGFGGSNCTAGSNGLNRVNGLDGADGSGGSDGMGGSDAAS